MIYFFFTTVDILDFDPEKDTHIHKEQRILFSSHETFTKISKNLAMLIAQFINILMKNSNRLWRWDGINMSIH